MPIGDRETAKYEFFRLLQSLFQAGELRRFLRYRADYALLCDGLPGEEASWNIVADAAVQALDRHGLITQKLFDELLQERPYRRDQIGRVAAIWDALSVDEEGLAARKIWVGSPVGLGSAVAAAEGSIHAAEISSRSPGGHGNVPLKFASISIDSSDPNWREAIVDLNSPFDRPCSQGFKLIDDADPIFDVTLLNISDSPTIFIAIGIQVLTVCRRDYRGLPAAGKIRKSDAYVLPMPQIAQRLRDRFGRAYAPQDVQEMIVEKLPDPIYLEPKAPYRYALLLKDYSKNIPNWARIRMLAITDQGESRSDELELKGSARAPL